MIYPLLWLVGSSLKPDSEIFGSVGFIPESPDFSAYFRAWQTVTPYSMGHYFLNTFFIVVPKIIFTLVSSTLTAYGFARFDFPMKKFFFALLMGVMFIPSIVVIIPSYLMWSKVGLTDTYIPLTIPSLFAVEGSFVFMIYEFIKGVPKQLDEASKIDGCGAIRTLVFIIVPCIKPVLISVAVFTFLWTVNDFMTPLIMISSVEKYPLSLILRLSSDATGNGYEQNTVLAMSAIGLIPSLAVFAFAQRKIMDSITFGGIS